MKDDGLADYSTNKRMLLLCLMALPIGALSALVAKALLWLIAVITNLAFYQTLSSASVQPQGHHLGAWVILVPVIGALIIGIMARYGSEKIRGHGIPEALEAILLGRSLIQPRVAILKPISSAISIGTGGPFGAEGPIIMTGGAFGSIFAQLFHLTAAERKTLLVAGAAGGMSAVFATPVAAVLLGVELLLFEWKPRSFVPVAVASLMASVVRVPLLGTGPIFPVPGHEVATASLVGAAVLVGLVTGLGSTVLTNAVYACEDLFARLPIHWMWWPALGGIIVGIGGYMDPRVLGVGYVYIDSLVNGHILGAALITLLIAKAIVWSVSLGSGTSGGVLAPLLIIGGSLGAIMGHWIPMGDPGLWAMVAMAAVMGSAMSAPLTGTFFVLELTHDLNALPLLFTGSVISFAVTVLLLKRSILTEKLARRGQHIAREFSVDVMELSRVGEIMDRTAPTISHTTTIAALAKQIADGDPLISKRQGTLIVDANGGLAGIITRGDIVRALQCDPSGAMTALEAGCSQPIVAYPEEPLSAAIARMVSRNIGRLPVVDRNDPTRLVGYLGRAGILSARLRFQEEEEIRERGWRLLAKSRVNF